MPVRRLKILTHAGLVKGISYDRSTKLMSSVNGVGKCFAAIPCSILLSAHCATMMSG